MIGGGGLGGADQKGLDAPDRSELWKDRQPQAVQDLRRVDVRYWPKADMR